MTTLVPGVSPATIRPLGTGGRAAEGTGLLNRRTASAVPRVRIPPCPFSRTPTKAPVRPTGAFVSFPLVSRRASRRLPEPKSPHMVVRVACPTHSGSVEIQLSPARTEKNDARADASPARPCDACWKDDALRDRFMSDPRAVLEVHGGIDVKVVEHADDRVHITLPARPPRHEELSDDELTEAAGGLGDFEFANEAARRTRPATQTERWRRPVPSGAVRPPDAKRTCSRVRTRRRDAGPRSSCVSIAFFVVSLPGRRTPLVSRQPDFRNDVPRACPGRRITIMPRSTRIRRHEASTGRRVRADRFGRLADPRS